MDMNLDISKILRNRVGTGADRMEALAIKAVGRPISAASGAVTLLRVCGTCIMDKGCGALAALGPKGVWRMRGRIAHSMQNVLDAIGRDTGTNI